MCVLEETFKFSAASKSLPILHLLYMHIQTIVLYDQVCRARYIYGLLCFYLWMCQPWFLGEYFHPKLGICEYVQLPVCVRGGGRKGERWEERKGGREEEGGEGREGRGERGRMGGEEGREGREEGEGQERGRMEGEEGREGGEGLSYIHTYI